jgi:hypothetical protein
VNDLIELTQKEWFEQFIPRITDLALHDLFSGNNKDIVKEYPEEINFIKAGANKYIWSLSQDKDENYFLRNGFYETDSLGYFFCNVSFNEQLDYYIKIVSSVEVLKSFGLSLLRTNQ